MVLIRKENVFYSVTFYVSSLSDIHSVQYAPGLWDSGAIQDNTNRPGSYSVICCGSVDSAAVERRRIVNTELFSNWPGAVRMLMRDQRRKAFTMLALSEADDDPGWALSDALAAVNAPAVAGASMAMASSRPGDAQSPSVILARPMETDDLADELAATARNRVAALGCPHCDAKEMRPWGTPAGCRAIVTLIAGGPSTP